MLQMVRERLAPAKILITRDWTFWKNLLNATEEKNTYVLRVSMYAVCTNVVCVRR